MNINKKIAEILDRSDKATVGPWGEDATHRKETMQTADPAQKGLNAARQVAQWHLGDPNWADRIIGAYINPEAGLDRLREEKATE